MSWTLPEDFPSIPESLKKALDRAARAGTLNKVDRSLQYESPEYATNEALRKAVNELGNKYRDIERKVASDIWHRIVLIAAIAEWAIIILLLEKIHP